jgi:uncharacterized membrane protein
MSLLTLHRFLKTHFFYPLALATGLALGMYAGRFLLSGYHITYLFLPWNIFLAWTPYLFSLGAAAVARRWPRAWLLLIPLGILWLLFFPNAPYLVTDFLHLRQRGSIPLWYDTILLAAFAWSGCFLGVASLNIMQRLIRRYLGRWLSWLFVAGAVFGSGLGTYIGRFERWNSWDLLIHPRSIVISTMINLINPFGNIRFLGFTLLFTAFFLVCYLTFFSIRPGDDK